MVHSVHGMGGIGKTQLAAEYAHACARGYDLVWWIAAEEPAAIPDQFTALAARLVLPPATEPDALQAQVHDRLRTVPGWLLIFDNADATADIQPWLPPGPMPPGVPGHVIVTTRRGGFGAMGQVMDLDVIGLADAVRLLRSRVPDLGQETAEQIAAELGRLPLALEQAAAYLDISQMPGHEYLELLRTRAADLLRRGTVAARQDITIATLWDLSLERITSQRPAAVQLLDLCAYLAPEPIPLDLFTTHPDLLPQPLSAATADQLTFADTLAVLADYSLAKRTDTGLQLHRLVQAAIRARHQHTGPAAQTPEKTGQGGGPAHDPLTVTLAVLRANAPEKITGVPAAWPRWTVLLPHVLAATDHLGPAAGEPSPVTMEDASWLLDRAATYLRVRGRPADAKPLLERALAIDEAAYGPDHPNVALRLNNLALTLRDLGQPGTARPLQERSLAITEAAYGPDHPEVATRLANLAATLWDLGQPQAAQPLEERALAIDEAAFGPDHPNVALSLDNLALTLRDLGQPQAARPLQERALAIDEAAYGPDHPDVALRLDNLAATLRDLGQPQAARPLQERALAITEAAYGPDHPNVAIRLNNLALTLRDLGQPGTARPLQERALANTEAAYGPDHPDVAIRLDNLALTLRDLGQPHAARPLQERALAITEAAYGPDHPDVAIRLDNLALTLRDLGQPGTARPLQERALANTEAAYGPDHPDVAIRLDNLALTLRDLGQPQAARPLQERALAITETTRSARTAPPDEEKDT